MPIGSRIQMPHTPNPSIGQGNSYFTKRGRPMLFQVTDPTNQPLWPYLLALHVNPKSFNESFTKSKNVVMSYGGFIEFVWPDDLDSISASATTGGFLGPFSGLTAGSEGHNLGNTPTGFPSGRASGRQKTMAWERQEDLLDLFRNNGAIFDGSGKPVVRGRVMCIYDRGIYVGHFTSFSPKEDDEHAFSFELDWEFKVEQTIYVFPGASNQVRPGQAANPGRPSEQVSPEVRAEVSQLVQDHFDNGPPIEGATVEDIEDEFANRGPTSSGTPLTQEDLEEFISPPTVVPTTR